MQFELDDEFADAIVVAELRNAYEMLLKGNNTGMYSFDDEENNKEVKKLRKALKRVHNYFSVPSEHIG
jgi:hypothetical protein